MTQGSNVFEAIFENVTTGLSFTGNFTLKDYIQARQWLECPRSPELASQMAIWLIQSNLNRQSAYCAIKVWKDVHSFP